MGEDMVTRSFTIWNKSGLHVRPASVLASGLAPFHSTTTLVFGGVEYNAKSPLRLLAACVKAGHEIELRVDGPDEDAAMAMAASLIEAGLGD